MEARIKPDLRMFFSQMPLVGMWIEHDYNKAETLDDMIGLFHKWIEEAETTDNSVRKSCYLSSAYYLYSWISGKSYESKIINCLTPD